MQEIFNSHIVYQNKDGIEYIQFKKLLEYLEVTHCYTLRSGDMLNFPPVYKDEKMLKQSYQRICECLGLDASRVMKPHQTHTDNIEVVNEVTALEDVCKDCLIEELSERHPLIQIKIFAGLSLFGKLETEKEKNVFGTVIDVPKHINVRSQIAKGYARGLALQIYPEYLQFALESHIQYCVFAFICAAAAMLAAYTAVLAFCWKLKRKNK